VFSENPFLYGKSAYIFEASRKHNAAKIFLKIIRLFRISTARLALILGIIALLLALLENFKIHPNSRFWVNFEIL